MKLFLNDKFIIFLILLNSFVIFIGGFFESHNFLINLLDNAITILFVVELLIKIKKFGIKEYFSSNWNIFDFILIIISIPSLIIYLFNIDLFDLSFLLVFRILRLFKAFRFFKFIPNIEKLIQGIQRALTASIFILISFIIYVFILGVLSFYLFNGVSTEYFSDPIVSLYSIFKIFTVEGWFIIPETIASNQTEVVGLFTHFYFIFILLTGGIFGLSLINSIFVDAMISDNNDDLEKKVDELTEKINQLLNG